MPSALTLGAAGDLLIIGCGYTGQAVARRCRQQGIAVTGTCAHPNHLQAVAHSGATAQLLKLGHALSNADGRRALGGLIAAHRYLLLSVGPERAPDRLSADAEPFRDYTEAVLSVMADIPGPEAVVYLSSTGVYGNRNGDWVDENSPVGAANLGPRGALRVQAEAALLGSGLPVRILRSAGIYGPGRHLGLRIRSGDYRVIEADPPLVVNRIHVDDLAQAVMRCLLPPAPAITVVADGVPATLREVADYTAGLMGLPVPPGESAQAARERMGEANFHLVADRKRCKNTGLTEGLGVVLAYPSYREGIHQALSKDGLLS